jgi:hypothetical protein
MLTIQQHEQKWRYAARARAEEANKRTEREKEIGALKGLAAMFRHQLNIAETSVKALKALAMSDSGRRRFDVAEREMQRVFFDGLIEHAMPGICKMARRNIVERMFHFLHLYKQMRGREVPADFIPEDAYMALMKIANDREFDLIPRPGRGEQIAEYSQVEVACFWPRNQEYHYMITLPSRGDHA